MADELLKAVGRVWPGRVIWGGHSWGGKLAALLAARHPDRTSAVVLIDPSPASAVPISAQDFVETTLAPELGSWPSLEAADAHAKCLPHYASGTNEVMAAFHRGLIQQADGTVHTIARQEWLLEIARIALTIDHSETIRRASAPTILVMAGDSMFWQEGTNVAALPNAVHEIVAGQHWIHWQKPTEVSAIIRRFLENL